jgi:hypothetical protein
MKTLLPFSLALIFIFFSAGYSQSGPVNVAGVTTVDRVVTVNGETLKLNGAGVRTKFIIRFYVAALYTPKTATTSADVLNMPGSKRLTIVLLRDVSVDEFFFALAEEWSRNNNNNDKKQPEVREEWSLLLSTFAEEEGLEKGDIITLDFLPGGGLRYLLNDRLIGTSRPANLFYQSVLKIWLGDSPPDRSLKAALLRGRAD